MYQTEYRSHEKLTVSDHKPVSAVFKVGLSVVDDVRRRKVQEEIERKLDTDTPDSQEIFDRRRFMESFYGIMNRRKLEEVLLFTIKLVILVTEMSSSCSRTPTLNQQISRDLVVMVTSELACSVIKIFMILRFLNIKSIN